MENINTFLEFAESLKLVRRAEIEFDGKNVIDEIYTDLLPNSGIISKVNLPRTTIVVGRKGTGKSTIFLKSQQDLNSNKKILTLYIDVKSLFDNSTPTFPSEIKNLPDSQELIKYLIYTNFIKQIILKTKEKIKSNIEKKALIKFFDLSDSILEDVYRELDNIDENIDDVFKKLNSSLLTFFYKHY
jgi:ABC-type lipoprotein export system ATPase subunit